MSGMASSSAQRVSYQSSVVTVEKDKERYIERCVQVIGVYDHSTN